MRLKVATTTALAVGIVLLLMWNLMVGPTPGPHAPRAELKAYGIRLVTQFGLTAASFLIAAILAMLLARQTRSEYANEVRSNVANLVEGSLRDHARDKSADDATSD
jgi:hypothetical protein